MINSKGKDDWQAFDIPLALMYKEEFKQPIFGANYLQGIIE